MKWTRLILLVLLPVALGWSCSRREEPLSETDSEAIGFDVRINAAVDADAKSTLITAAGFSSGQSFIVFGRRVGEGKNTRVFESAGTTVTWNTPNAGVWNYSPPSYWYWVNQSNYYDFLAAHPASAQRMVDESGKDIPGNLAIQKAYSIDSDDYDLLLAGTRRFGTVMATRTNQVPLVFQHMLCAVRVVIINESDGASFTLETIDFDNLIRDAKAKVTIDVLGDPEFSWIDSWRTNGTFSIFNSSETPAPTLAPSGEYSAPSGSGYQFFIPADLTEAVDGSLEPQPAEFELESDPEAAYEAALADYEDLLPHLIITYSTEEPNPDYPGVPEAPEFQTVTHEPDPIVLRNILKARYGTSECVTSWEMGKKYTYYISIRVDGDVLVRVVTTEWEEVEAETPGLLIE